MPKTPTRTPKTYSTSADTLLGRLFSGLMQHTPQPQMQGQRPDFAKGFEMPNGYTLDAVLNDLNVNGAGGTMYGGLNQADPAIAKQVYDTWMGQRDYDAMAGRIAKIQAARNAIGSGNATMGDMFTVGKDYLGQHKLGTMAGAGLALGNLGGLTDNDKFGGQLGGLGLGALAAHGLAGGMSNPGMSALMMLGGGELGALFDKLRAKREGQRQQMSQQMPRR